MAKIDLLTDRDTNMFGFCGCSGFWSVRFLLDVRVLLRSGCSVDFVEKMWRSLRKTLWKIRGKNCLKLWKNEFSTFLWRIIHEILNFVESFTTSFTQGCFPVSGRFCTFSTEPIITTTNLLMKEEIYGN